MNAIIENAIQQGIEDVNVQQENGHQLLNEDQQILIGEGSPLDSLGILIFVTAVESRLKSAMPGINLVDLLMVADNAVHFATLGAFKRYLTSLA